jgi:hypothetical protein
VALDQITATALVAIDPKNLYISDVKELALRIQRAVESDSSSQNQMVSGGIEARVDGQDNRDDRDHTQSNTGIRLGLH